MVRGIGNALKRHGSGLRKFHRETGGAEVAPELLAEQNLDIRFIVNYENEQVHARPPDLLADARTRQHDPKFGELTELRIDLNRPAMLLHDDVVTDGQA